MPKGVLALFAIPELIRHREEQDACQDPNSPAIEVCTAAAEMAEGGDLTMTNNTRTKLDLSYLCDYPQPVTTTER
jgi:hypothetical protein